jgi:predicted TIM-barrel fold metal-dependent hydrolase
MKYASPGLTLTDVFRQALSVVGPERLLFGTDSSFFPRGWIADVYQQQSQALEDAGATASAKEKVFGGNFERVFPI